MKKTLKDKISKGIVIFGGLSSLVISSWTAYNGYKRSNYYSRDYLENQQTINCINRNIALGWKGILLSELITLSAGAYLLKDEMRLE